MSRSEGVEYQPMIRELPAGERPRERLKKHGAGQLSNAELLAIVLRTGSSSDSVLSLSTRLLARFGGLEGLNRAGIGELCEEHGLGEVKAGQIKAALELGRRLVSAQPGERVTVRSPQDIAHLLQAEMGLLEQEELRTVLLNTKNQVMGVPHVYKGSVNHSSVRIAEVFKEAVRENCPALIVVHNHPSGDPTPSPEDIKVTEELVQAGKMLCIDVLDHVIFGRQNWVSLKERRQGFK